jgi:hypothetical protein
MWLLAKLQASQPRDLGFEPYKVKSQMFHFTSQYSSFHRILAKRIMVLTNAFYNIFKQITVDFFKLFFMPLKNGI